MVESRLQSSEIPLYEFGGGPVVIEPVHPGRKAITVEKAGRKLLKLSPEEAYTIGASLIDHAEECGFDYDTGETRDVG